MKELSQWADNHRAAVLLLIISGNLFLAIIGLAFGICLNGHAMVFSKVAITIIVWISLTVLYIATGKARTGERLNNSQLDRICHALIYCCAFLFFVIAGNKLPGLVNNYEQKVQAIPLYIMLKDKRAERTNNYPKTNTGEPRFMMGEPGIKNQLRVAVYTIEAHNEDLPKDFVLFLLTLGGITAAGLSCLLAALSKTVSCAGIQLAAGSLAMLATGSLVGAVVLLLILIIKLAGP